MTRNALSFPPQAASAECQPGRFHHRPPFSREMVKASVGRRRAFVAQLECGQRFTFTRRRRPADQLSPPAIMPGERRHLAQVACAKELITACPRLRRGEGGESG